MGSQLEVDRLSRWQRLYNRQGRLDGVNKLEGHVVSTLRKRRMNGKQDQAIRPQSPPLVTHFLQQGPTSQKFHRPLRQ